MHHAAEAGHLDSVRLLLELRADVTATTSGGQRPEDLARDPAVKELLQRQGAERHALPPLSM